MHLAPIIQTAQLARRYGRRWALADVNLEVAAGSVLMVIGRNGSGKTTLFRVLATAIRSNGGRASVGGFDVDREREDVRRMVSLLSHHSYLYDSLSAHENLRVVADHRGGGHERITPLLERFALASRANDIVATFSAGMRKRLSFARLLLQEPKVVMLDEPYGQLDPEGFGLVDQVVRELTILGTTVLIATHQVERGAALAERAIILDSGRLIWSGPAEEAASRQHSLGTRE